MFFEKVSTIIEIILHTKFRNLILKMCYQFTLVAVQEQIKIRYQINENFSISNNTASFPWQPILAITNNDWKNIANNFLRWLKPKRLTSKSIKIFNTRIESLTTKKYFQNLFQHNRCLIPANHFIERDKITWKKYNIWIQGQQIISFAWIYETIQNWNDWFTIYTSILTCPANTQISKYHDRMPIILKQQDEQIWLENNNYNHLTKLLQPYENTYFL